MVQLEVTDRGMSYNPSVAEAFDQGSIDLYGIRRDASVKASAIVDPYYVGAVVAQLVLQRQLLYRNTYSFQLGWKYILLEPMDLVQITDPRLGAQALTVRITSIEEDDEGALSVTCEDWFGTPGTVMYPPVTAIPTFGGVVTLGSGGSTAMPYPKQSGAAEASSPNYGQAAPSINAPFILEPTAESAWRRKGRSRPTSSSGCRAGRSRPTIRTGVAPMFMYRLMATPLHGSVSSSAARRWGSRPRIARRRARRLRSISPRATAA